MSGETPRGWPAPFHRGVEDGGKASERWEEAKPIS